MRRRARTCALQILYQLDLAKELSPTRFNEPAVRAGMARFWASFEAVEGDDEQFAERLVLGIAQDVERIDRTLGDVSQNWRVGRMDKVDRNILRLAAYELTACPDIPRAASINEAVELAKLFSSPESAAFINGVLDQLARNKPEPKAEQIHA
jgi:N utilization substance protein B